jgi:phosphoserine phosphatase RsbU/P
MGFLVEHLSRQSKFSLLIRGYLTVALILLVDYVTGPDTSFLIFYFFPIIVISWYIGRKHGLRMALASALGSSIHDCLFMHSLTALGTSESLIYWGILQKAVVFVIVSITVTSMKSLEEKKRHIENKIAQQVQSFLLPRNIPSTPHFTCHAFTKSCDYLSGDLFDCAFVGPDKLSIIVGDVCGKGVSAALLMAYIQGVLRSHLPLRTQTLGSLMRSVNRALYASTAEEKYATLFIGVYDDMSRNLTYVNAGHQPPMVFRWDSVIDGRIPAKARLRASHIRDVHQKSDKPEILKLEPGDLILGVDPLTEFHPHVLKMTVGDILVCETDGVEEARNHLGELYSLERLARVVSANREKSPEELGGLMMKDIEEFVGMEPQHDDITLAIGKVV